MGTAGVMWWVSNEQSTVVGGEQSGPQGGTDGRLASSRAIGRDGELVRECGVVCVVTRLWVAAQEMI